MGTDQEGSAPLCLAALYMRLSKDDDAPGESASIATQRKLLRAFAHENGYTIAGEYIDDGFTGVSFDRPGFNRMIKDIEQKKINMVITKDLSRLGRDYITAGRYTELYFPEHMVRYIAINDGYDSAQYMSDIAPFRHVINEMYARDASKKIRSSLNLKMKEGSFIGSFAPYGYKKDGENKNRLVVDPDAASVVEKVFEMAARDCSPADIARMLNGHAIAPPSLYRSSGSLYLNAAGEPRKGWTSASVCKLLGNTVYLGHTSQGKTVKPSFKSSASIRRPPHLWYVVKSTHEPIVTRELYYRAKSRRVSRRLPPNTGFKNVFSGLALCGDCGRGMSTTVSRKKGAQYNLVCGGYKLYGKRACTNHFIDYGLLYEAVLAEVRAALSLSKEDKDRLLARVNNLGEDKKKEGGDFTKPLAALKRREAELDALIEQLYEDNVKGKISDERFLKLLSTYESRQRETSRKIEELTAAAREDDCSAPPLSRHLFNSLLSPKELTPHLLKGLIERIEVCQGSYESTGGGKVKGQTVRIFWRLPDETGV